MTLIAAIRPENIPILMGDILLSRRLPPDDKLHLPTIGEIEHSNQTQVHHLVGLDQKIALIHDQIAISWCGSRSLAKKIIVEARSQFKNILITRDDLGSFLNDAVPNHADVAFVGSLFEKGKGQSVFHHGGYDYETDYFGSCTVAGTGQGYFSDYIYADFRMGRIIGTPNPLQVAFSKSLTLSTLLLGREIMTGDNLSHYFGGGYEHALLNGSKFIKVGDILRAFWICEKQKDSARFTLLPVMLRFDYVDDILLIKSAFFEDGFKRCKTHISAIAPIYMDNTHAFSDINSKIQRDDWNATFLASTILLKEENAPDQVLGIINHSPSRQQPLSLSREGNELQFGIDMAFWKPRFERMLGAPVTISDVAFPV